MANTFELIASYTVDAAGTNNFSFTSIPQTYTDLVLKISARSSTTNNSDTYIQLNASTTGYTQKMIRGSGSAAASYDQSVFGADNIEGSYTSNTANMFNNLEYYIPNYTGSTYKSVSSDGVQEDNVTAAYSLLTAGLLSNTAPVTSIKVMNNTTNTAVKFAQYTTAYLYGVKNA